MRYFFTNKALKDIKKLSKQDQKRILTKLDYFIKQENIMFFRESLINSALGTIRFRVGDFRIICDVGDENLIVLRVGHRRDIYK